MTTQDKLQIVELIKQQLAHVSQNKLATKIGQISGPTLSMVVNLKWKDNDQLISAKMWNILANYFNYQRSWAIVENDRNTRKMMNICKHVQHRSVARMIVGDPGLSKSASLKLYAQQHTDNVFYIECANYLTKKEFLNQLRKAMGISGEVFHVVEQIRGIVAHLSKLRKPLIIVDEMDKLRDDIISVILALYNHLEGRCGWVMCGSMYLEKRIEKGVRLKKQSYRELYSRVGGQMETLYELTRERVAAICSANGVTDQILINRVWQASDNDLRRVKNEVETIRLETENGSEAA